MKTVLFDPIRTVLDGSTAEQSAEACNRAGGFESEYVLQPNRLLPETRLYRFGLLFRVTCVVQIFPILQGRVQAPIPAVEHKCPVGTLLDPGFDGQMHATPIPTHAHTRYAERTG